MTGTRTAAAAQTRQHPAARPRLAILCVGALLAGFCFSTALTAPLVAEQRQSVGEWGAVILFAAVAIPLAITDARTHRLPNRGTFPLAAGLLGYWTGVATTTGQWQLLTQSAIATAAILAVAIIIALLSTLSAGDMKLFLAIGLLTGWISWMLPLYVLAGAYLLAVPHAALTLARKRSRPDASTRLPFGPYLVTAALAVTIAALVLAS